MAELTPVQIFKEYDAQPPLQRPRYISDLFGTTVDWPVKFFDASAIDADVASVAFHYEALLVRMITGKVSRSAYPRLENLCEGEPMRMRGRIRSVSALCIELDITELLFCIEAAFQT